MQRHLSGGLEQGAVPWHSMIHKAPLGNFLPACQPLDSSSSSVKELFDAGCLLETRALKQIPTAQFDI